MKSYTDIEQSKKLAEILPLESADMHYNNVSIKGINYVDEYRVELINYNNAIKILSKYTINPLFGIVPCWSLTALFSVLPLVDFITPQLIGTPKTLYRCMYDDDLKSHAYDNPIDACYEMIMQLYKQKLL